MTQIDENSADALALEGMIDRHGLYAVTTAIAKICRGKAEHLASNWQDITAERAWEKAGKVFDRAWVALRKIQIAA